MREYRVVWKREGSKARRKQYVRRSSAERRIALMTVPDPWRLFGKDGDDFMCCSGYQCGCRGVTIRQNEEEKRASYPKLEYARLETRQVGPWEAS